MWDNGVSFRHIQKVAILRYINCEDRHKLNKKKITIRTLDAAQEIKIIKFWSQNLHNLCLYVCPYLSGHSPRVAPQQDDISAIRNWMFTNVSFLINK